MCPVPWQKLANVPMLPVLELINPLFPIMGRMTRASSHWGRFDTSLELFSHAHLENWLNQIILNHIGNGDEIILNQVESRKSSFNMV